MDNISKKHKSSEIYIILMDSKKVASFFSIMILLGTIFAIIAMAGCTNNGDGGTPADPEPTKGTAKWADYMGKKAVRDAWKSDASLVYLEWLNCNETGIMTASDAITLYYGSNQSTSYYRITVDLKGATEFEKGEVATTSVFTTGGGNVATWAVNSNVVLPDAHNYFLKPDDEYVYRFYVQPADTIEKDLNTTHPIVRVQTQHQTMYFDGVSGDFITRFSAIL